MDAEQPTIDHLIIALPLAEKVPVVALHSLLEERERLDEQQEDQLQAIHKEYAEKIKPYLQRVSQLIQGKDPLPEEVAALGQYLKIGEKEPQLKGKIIDRYWNAALQNSAIAQFITEKDEKALEFLQDIQVADAAGSEHGLNLKFVFKANPYFTETSIVRRLKYAEGKPVCLQGDQVTWKAGSWLTHESKKVNNKTTGESKVMKGKKIESFFDIFQNWTVNENPKELQKCFQILYDLMGVIRDSLSYFLGLFDVEGDSDQEQDYEDEDEEEQETPKKVTRK